jgi:hypothetical protein
VVCHNEIGFSKYSEFQGLDIGEEWPQTRVVAALLAKLYVLGKKYQMPLLRNDVVDAFLLLIDEYLVIFRLLSAELLEFIWQNTLQNCPLRRLILVKIPMEFNADEREHIVNDDALSKAFCADIAVACCLFYGNREKFEQQLEETEFCHNVVRL